MSREDTIKQEAVEQFQTCRHTVPEMEEILYKPFPVLDHGFVRVVDYMGDDSAIVQAARVSYGRGTTKTRQDQGLINYLMRHWHTTPFEMCEIKFHIKMPIFVARQWLRHRTASVNEYSARYSILAREFYVPAAEHLAAQSTSNRQGRGDTLLPEQAQEVLQILTSDSQQVYDHYEYLLNSNMEGEILDPSRVGLTRELARMNLTLNYYTELYWKTNLHNLFHFLRLRADSHAQYEIRVYAEVMLDLVKKWVPYAYEAFVKYRLEAAQLSKPALDVVRKMLKGEQVTPESSGMSMGEWREFATLLGLPLGEKSEAA